MYIMNNNFTLAAVKCGIDRLSVTGRSTCDLAGPKFLCPLCDEGDQSTISERPARGLFCLGEVQGPVVQKVDKLSSG